METIDTAIIGGGVVGLAVASAISAKENDIFIFEKNESFGQEISSRNSEVMHSGIYYPADSLKTRTCVEGRRLLYRICRDYGVPCKRTGKLIVAKKESELSRLEGLRKQAIENGLEGIKMLDKKDIKKMEPNIGGVQALFLPESGIIDSHALMKYFLSMARDNGADIIYNSEVTRVDPEKGFYRITVKDAGGREYAFKTRIVINSAGLNSDTVSALAGITGYKLSYCKGDYFRVGNGKNTYVNGLVYPVCGENSAGLGIHATPDLAGGLRLGPDAEYLASRKIDYSVDPGKKESFYDDVKSLLPFLEKDDIYADMSGIRPKLQTAGGSFKDFVIKHEIDSGLSGFINLIGIESPGLTSAPSIALMVKKMILEYNKSVGHL